MIVTVTETDVYPLTLNEEDAAKSVRQNIALILTSFRGTIPLYRDFGLSSESIDKPINVARTMLISDIKESVETYEPRATVTDITFKASPDNPSTIIPVVEVEING